MDILVLGASGMAGHMIVLYLQQKGFHVDGFARRKLPFVNTIVGDARDSEMLNKIINVKQYNIVVNCIGILNKNAELNKSEAVLLNAYLPHMLADFTHESKTRIFHISTDCVFSGKSGPYYENSFKDGETFYDRSKALGELEDNKNLTIRCSIVGPDINPEGIGLFNWFMRQHGTILGYKGALWTGITTLQLAHLIESAAANDVTGVYNMVPDHNISKYDLLRLFNHYCRDGEVMIKENNKFIADKTLIRTRFDFDEEIPDYKTMIKDMAEWIKNHRKLYPQYDIR